MAATLSLSLGCGDALYGDRFRIDAPLGRGQSGRVFRSWDRRTGSTVALKIVPIPPGDAEPARARFLDEAARYAALEHPGVVRVLAYGEADYQGEPSFFLAMEWARGRTVERLLFEDGRVPEPRALEIAGRVVDALRAAHARRVVHGDLKASQVVLVDAPGGEAIRVLDFDLARVDADACEALTVIDSAADAPCHEPPEKLLKGQVDARTDVYSVGALLYRLVTGRPPFIGTRHAEIMLAQLSQDPEPPSACSDAEVSPALEALILRCLEKDPAARPQDMGALARALEVLQAPDGGDAVDEITEALAAPPTIAATPSTLAPVARERGAVWAAAAAVAVALAGGIALAAAVF